MRFVGALAAAALMVLLAGRADAATIIGRTTVNLSTALINDDRLYAAGSTPISFVASEGDQISLAFDFKDDQALTFSSMEFLVLVVGGAAEPSTAVLDGTLTFLDVMGNDVLTVGPRTTRIGPTHIGQLFYPIPGESLPNLVFGGIRLDSTIIDYEQPGVITRSYNQPSLVLRGKGIRLVSSIPEPSTWAIMIVGIGAVAAGLRKRRVPAVL